LALGWEVLYRSGFLAGASPAIEGHAPLDPLGALVPMPFLITALYVVAACIGASFAWVELRLLARYWRHRGAIRALAGTPPRSAAPRPGEAPRVTIQIPLYNERTMAERVIEAAAAQDYPKDRFEIQVLDDSTDETRDVVARVAERVRSRGVRIVHRTRESREGYKAGALAEGLRHSEAELVALFDADFSPEPGFLRSVVLEDRAFDDPRVAFVQTRWAFEDASGGVLASAQSLLLDRHFFIQKPARAFLGGITTFNGSGGIWRRSAIDEAGGWSAETLTEDLDLSFRSALKGWRGRYLHHISVPSQLPGHMRAFKVQQRRWARGTAQCMRKLTGRVLGSRGLLDDRWDEAFLLAGYAIHPILLANLLLWPWAVLYVDRGFFFAMQLVMSLATVVAPITLGLTMHERGDDWSLRSVGTVLAGVCVGIGLMVNNTAGQFLGFLRRPAEFARTPKGSSPVGSGMAGVAPRGYTSALHWTFFVELLAVGYCIACAALLVQRGEGLWAIPLLFWAGCLGLVAQLQVVPQPA